ncbi:hypothetical protein L0Y49_03140, partial [bacterium]|nr:hypothetical protein [bacterium]
KTEIPEEELLHRAKQFEWYAPVLFTRSDGLFVDKVRRFAGFSFVLGADTLNLILNPKFDVEPSELFETFLECGSHFSVPPRLENDLETILQYFTEKPWWKQQYHGMFTPLDFRMDISSTEIRKNAAE